MPFVLQSALIARNHVAGKNSRTTALLTAVAPTPTAFAISSRPTVSAICLVVLMTRLYPQMVEIGKTTIGGLPARSRFGNAPTTRELVLMYEQIGRRLLAVRTGFSDLSQKDWAVKHGFNPTQYNNWEKGVRRIPVESAEKLAETYGLTLDFIYRGRRDGLSDTAANTV